MGGQKCDGEFVGLDLLALVLSGRPGLAQIQLRAGKDSPEAQNMSL